MADVVLKGIRKSFGKLEGKHRLSDLGSNVGQSQHGSSLQLPDVSHDRFVLSFVIQHASPVDAADRDLGRDRRAAENDDRGQGRDKHAPVDQLSPIRLAVSRLRPRRAAHVFHGCRTSG